MAEDKFEQAVIDKLKSEGWEYLTDYSGVTVDRVHDHWRDILDANNRKRLEDTPLSDNEFEQFQKYDGDGMCTGLFSFVQVQFVLSQNSAHYFARPKNSHSYNRDFAFGWRDDDGKDVTQSVNCATINHHENRKFARSYYYNLSNSSTQYLIR